MYKPIKELGQNFLDDQELAWRMVNALNIQGYEDIVEIGPGHGILTDSLVERVVGTDCKVYAVEIDKRFYEKLSAKYVYETKINIVEGNILDWLPTFNTQRDCKVLGSLPYYITSPIIHKIIKMISQPSTCVILIQQEVAEKISAKAPDSSYMSSFVQLFYNVTYLELVPKEKFEPMPSVDGAVLLLKKKDVNYGPMFIEKIEGFLHRAYSNPRKMLNKVFTIEELNKGGIDPTLRAQNINAEEWLSFYKVLNSDVNHEI